MEILGYKNPQGESVDISQKKQPESVAPQRRVNKYQEIITNYLKYPEKTPKQLAMMMGYGYSSEYISQCIHRYRRSLLEQKAKQERIIADAVKYISKQAQSSTGSENEKDMVNRLLGRVLEYQIKTGAVSLAEIRSLIFNTPSLRNEHEYHAFLNYFSEATQKAGSSESKVRVEVA